MIPCLVCLVDSVGSAGPACAASPFRKKKNPFSRHCRHLLLHSSFKLLETTSPPPALYPPLRFPPANSASLLSYGTTAIALAVFTAAATRRCSLAGRRVWRRGRSLPASVTKVDRNLRI